MRIAALLVFLIACQGDPSSVTERAGKHTIADRNSAMASLSAGLDEAYLALKDKPNDTAAALARARTMIARYYTREEADAFELHVGSNEWMLYIPTQKPPTVWLARNSDHLIVEPDGLSPEAKKKVGL